MSCSVHFPLSNTSRSRVGKWLPWTFWLSHSGQSSANVSNFLAYWCMCVCVCVKNVRGWDCSLEADHWRMSKPRPLSLSSQTHTNTHRGLWHIPEADPSIVQALQWAIAFTYIKMSLGYRTAPEDPLLSVIVCAHTCTLHSHTHTHWRHTVCTNRQQTISEATLVHSSKVF